MKTRLAEVQAWQSASNSRILVVDDEPRMLSSLEALLGNKYHRVDTASGGRLACQKLHQIQYDLVLLDLNMGDFDGFSVMSYLANHHITTATVVVSGETTFDAARKALRMGAADFINKPYSADELFYVIDSILHNKPRRVEELAASVTDLSEEKATRQNLEKSNTLFNKAEQFGKLGHWEWDEITKRYITCSKQYAKLLDMTVKQMTKGEVGVEEARQSICERDREQYATTVDTALERQAGWNIEYQRINQAGESVYIHEIGEPVLDDHGAVVGTVGTIQDITDFRRMEEALQRKGTLALQAEAMVNIGHFCWDRKIGAMLYCSDQFARIYDSTVPEVLKYFISTEAAIDLVHPDDRALYRQASYDSNQRSIGLDVEYRVITRLGNTRHIRERGEIVLDDNNAPTQSFGTIQDITQTKTYQKHLERTAHYDALTNLPNRILLAKRLSHSMEQCQRLKQSLAVAYLDLDGFKAINDTHGHWVGDQLLVTLSKRMKDALRKGDTLARIGGDEFIAVMVNLNKIEDSEPLVKRLLEATGDPVTVGDALVQVSASIGVTLYRQDVTKAGRLLDEADQAMYIAKQAGKNRYHLFDTTKDT